MMRLALRSHALRVGLASTATAVILAGLLCSVALWGQPTASAHGWSSLPADASCARLASLDSTATNGSTWGITLLPGHNAAGGWFGVDVCGNGITAATPGGANLSCDRLPTDLARTGCAPGQATYDGFGLSFQCVELVVRFAAWAFDDSPADWHGNAPELWSRGNHPDDFLTVANGGAQAPVPGDMLVWGTAGAGGQPWPDGPADGHVAIVSTVRGAQLTFVEQNALAGGRNVPTETTTLRHVGARWIVGTGEPVATGTRTLYGWLHSTKNTGVWSGQRVARGVPPNSDASASNASTIINAGQLPSVASAVVVGQSGALADLTWSAGDSPLPLADAPTGPPHLSASSLGAPPSTDLARAQTPAVLLGTAGSRTIFARGTDGRLYAARTAPGMFGVSWQSLGGPANRALVGSPAASYFAGGVEVAALDAVGQMWWRAGPADNLGGWMNVGAPPSASLTSIWVAGAPGTGLPLAVGLGNDGQLYTSHWSDGGSESGNAAAGWDGWTALAFPDSTRLVGPMVGVSERALDPQSIGGWTDVPIDLLVADSLGELQLARLTASDTWRTQSLGLLAPTTRLIGAVSVGKSAANADAAAQLHVYVNNGDGLNLGEVTINGLSGMVSSHWETPRGTGQSSGAAPSSPSSVIGFGDDESLMVMPAATGVQVAGPAIAIAVAEPSTMSHASPTATAVDPAQSLAFASAGALPGTASFTDEFADTTLDARWVAIDASGAPGESGGTLTLPPPGSQGVALMLQGAPSGDATLETALTLPPGTSPSLRAGLVLYFDAANWLTLAVTGSGQVTLCAKAWGAGAPCRSMDLLLGQADAHTVALLLTRNGDRFTGSASSDSLRWTTVGTWTPTLPAGVPPALATDAAAPDTLNRDAAAQRGLPSIRVTAPLAFTSAGLFAEEDGTKDHSATQWPRFSFFSVVPATYP